MDLNPLVSIIIPVYNGANYMNSAIDSALGQTYPNIEVIVINDGSKDDGNTEAIAKSYGDKIRYFPKENGGVSSALNVGIKNMKGEWFSWLSHDDMYEPNKIASQIEYWCKNPEVKVIASSYKLIDVDRNTPDEVIFCPPRQMKNGRDFFDFGGINGCTMLIHRECFKKAGLFNEENHIIQDWEEWLKILKYEPVYFMPEILVRQRIHSQMGSQTLSDKYAGDKVNFFKMILEEFEISWFYPGDYHGTDSPQMQAKTYQWLARRAILPTQSPKSAFLCHQYSYRAYPSPANLSYYVHGIGEKKYTDLVNLYIKGRLTFYHFMQRLPKLHLFLRSIKNKP